MSKQLDEVAFARDRQITTLAIAKFTSATHWTQRSEREAIVNFPRGDDRYMSVIDCNRALNRLIDTDHVYASPLNRLAVAVSMATEADNRQQICHALALFGCDPQLTGVARVWHSTRQCLRTDDKRFCLVTAVGQFVTAKDTSEESFSCAEVALVVTPFGSRVLVHIEAELVGILTSGIGGLLPLLPNYLA